ncbi:Rpn family recombination-promoting nuclease/putative transposase [uncultured Lamprocystis sp.]|jgi:predicted transposase/invertase (TIGR01784 family)|uniref:Rpn family recombination-promoting nuclease/putative transposase n=1 Tax=uncultured Lamprocystis sp. TaxID=543132 RepID=UPI0025D745C4|nr:Rpn family recombination-promoting nuclease/putative transposase [uncultured Lamprocystis sp.]
MRHPIDPKVDCVFKALLGAESNRDLLIHFLNAILGAELPRPITAVEIQNPYNEKEFLDDKLTVVDVKARDATGQLYQVEIQLLNHRDLPARILYGWADLYSAQIKEGESYRKLRPTYAIWLLGQTLLADDPDYAHEFRLRDPYGRVFLDHGGIWLLELSKFAADAVETEQQRWLKFFTEAERLDADALPAWMQTQEMRRAMNTLKAFSEKEHAYHAYQARQDYLREQQSIQLEFDDLRAEVEQARAEAEHARADAEHERAAKEQERAAKEQAQADAEQERAAIAQERAAKEQERAAKDEALAENERLKRLLADKSEPSDPEPGQ